MYVRELTVRYRRRRIPGRRMPAGPLTVPAAAAALFLELLKNEAVEVCGMLCLTSRLHIVGYHELSRGTVDHTIVMARDVFRTALLAHAKAIVLGHNHRGGSVEPSVDDLALTRSLSAAGALLGIDVLDHLIVSPDRAFYSFKTAGRLP